MSRRRKVILALIALLAVAIAVNTVLQDRATKSAKVTTVGGKLLDLPGGELQVTDTPARKPRPGSRPIVLLHCYGCSLQWWDRMLPALSENHRVVRIDMLGFGGSEKPRGDYTMDREAAGVAAALERLGISDAVVVGHSLGFDVTAALAQRSPRLANRLVDIDEASDDDLLQFPFTARLAYVPVIGQALKPTTPDFLIEDGYKVAFAPGYDIQSGFRNPDQVVDDFRAMTYTSYDSAYEEQNDYDKSGPLDERVRQTGKPLLVLFGTKDQTWSNPRKAADGYRDVPGARIVMIPGAGHSPNVERPQRTAQLVLGFAEQARRPPRGR